jgi:hypothetical protein
VAPGPAQQHPRSLRGGARHLAGPGLRHLEHHVHRGGDRVDRRCKNFKYNLTT